MMQVALTAEMARFITNRIAWFPSQAGNHQWLAPFVKEFEALPIYVGWTETIGIRDDGEIVSWSTEEKFAGIRNVEDRILVLMSLVNGSRRYPELKELLPKRPLNALDCQCLDVPFLASGRVFCGTCGGVGWLPIQSETSGEDQIRNQHE